MKTLLHRGYRYRIYPDAEQIEYFIQTFGCRRKVYNAYVDALYRQLEAMKYESGYIRKKDLHFMTPAAMKAEFSFLKEVDSLALCNAQLAFQRALTRFNKEFDKKSYTKRSLKRKKTLGKEPTFRDLKGMPRFKSIKNGDFSYTTNNQPCGGKWSNIIMEKGWLTIPKLKTPIRVKQHRPLPGGSIIKNVTISMDYKGRFFASLGVEYAKEIIPVQMGSFVGLDYSQQDFFVDSEGKKANYPHYYRKSEKKLVREQRKLSHMVEGSQNWKKQKKKVNAFHSKISQQRRDWLHQKSTIIANQFDMVAVEDIDLRAMGQTLKLAKNLQDNGFGLFRTMLQYKLEERGKVFVKVDRFYPSSKLCSYCGYVYTELELKDRKWTCPCCGAELDRDHNAAINIREAGKRLLITA